MDTVDTLKGILRVHKKGQNVTQKKVGRVEFFQSIKREDIRATVTFRNTVRYRKVKRIEFPESIKRRKIFD